MNISDVAKKTGLTSKAIRFYEEKGLVTPPLRSENGYLVADLWIKDKWAIRDDFSIRRVARYFRNLNFPLCSRCFSFCFSKILYFSKKRY